MSVHRADAAPFQDHLFLNPEVPVAPTEEAHKPAGASAAVAYSPGKSPFRPISPDLSGPAPVKRVGSAAAFVDTSEAGKNGERETASSATTGLLQVAAETLFQKPAATTENQSRSAEETLVHEQKDVQRDAEMAAGLDLKSDADHSDQSQSVVSKNAKTDESLSAGTSQTVVNTVSTVESSDLSHIPGVETLNVITSQILSQAVSEALGSDVIITASELASQPESGAAAAAAEAVGGEAVADPAGGDLHVSETAAAVEHMEDQVATDGTTAPSLREAAQEPIMIVVDQSEAQGGAGQEEGEGAGQEGEEAEQGVVLMTLEPSGEEGYMALKAPKATYLAFSIAPFISLKQQLSFTYVTSFLCELDFFSFSFTIIDIRRIGVSMYRTVGYGTGTVTWRTGIMVP